VDEPKFGTPYEGTSLGAKPGASPFPTRDRELDPYIPEANDVTAAFYLLLRTQDIWAGVFNCPSTQTTPLEAPDDDFTAFTNWPGNEALAAHLSYSYQNPYPSAQAVGVGFKFNNSLTAEAPLAADMNPGTAAAAKALPPTNNAERDPAANTLNHFGDGQNVLYADAHVSFEQTPRVGIRRDNIYTRRTDLEMDDKRIIGPDAPDAGPPLDKFDAILLPTAEQIGQTVVPPTPEEVAGRFAADVRDRAKREAAAMRQAGERMQAQQMRGGVEASRVASAMQQVIIEAEALAPASDEDEVIKSMYAGAATLRADSMIASPERSAVTLGQTSKEFHDLARQARNLGQDKLAQRLTTAGDAVAALVVVLRR
jgi:hypothetical protein